MGKECFPLFYRFCLSRSPNKSFQDDDVGERGFPKGKLTSSNLIGSIIFNSQLKTQDSELARPARYTPSLS
jgi:hypothetical protein